MSEQRVWVKDLRWRLLPATSILRCRFMGDTPRKHCRNLAVAELLRSNGWWAYCPEHLYGRRITDKGVEIEVSAPDLLPRAESQGFGRAY